MKLRLYHISSRLAAAAVVVALTMALAACSSKGAADEPEMPATEYRAGFYVTVGDEAPQPTSRTPEGSYDEGSGLENYLDIKGGDIRVVLFNNDHSLLTEITDLQITPVATYESSKRYYINGATKADISSGQFKVMVLANWGKGNYPAPTEWTLEKVWATTYNFNGTGILTKDSLIPLYGIKKVTIPGGIRPDQAANLGTIHLLRAMAKIEVVFEEPFWTEDFWTVKSMRLTHYNTSGFCAPTDVVSQDQYVHGNWADDYTAGPSIPTDTENAGPLDFHREGKSWILYVPEYYNMPGASAPEPTIEVVFNEGLSDTKVIHFLDKSSGIAVRRNILRNYWYRFRLRKSDEYSNIQVEVDVVPYRVVELDPSFGLDTDD